MTMHAHAAAERAKRDLEQLLRTCRAGCSDEQLAARATKFIDGLRSAGWTHASERAAPPQPAGPPSPSGSDTAQQALARCRDIAADAIRRHQAENAKQPEEDT